MKQIILAIFLMIEAISAYGATEINFKNISEVSGGKIYLKDIAEIKSDKAVQIGSICMGDAPKAGMKRTFYSSLIEFQLRKNKLVPEDAKINIPKSVIVKQESQEIPEDKLKDLFSNYIGSKLNGEKFNISEFKVTSGREFPKGNITLNAANHISKNIIGRVNLIVEIFIDGKSYGKITVSGKIDRYKYAVCTKRIIPKHTVLTENDISLMPINMSKPSGSLILSIQDAIGKRVKNTINPSEYLKANSLESPPLIRKGDQVKIFAKNGSLSVSTIGISKSDGSKDEQIKVENSSSGKVVSGRVVSNGTVEIFF
ncbi:MAG: flagellar basal body P-ring formation protein FlgA [Desulfobacterales bacterium]|nr:flagellar basal body P-ring formation protein FlgA [Desulfobacterales bacterium]